MLIVKNKRYIRKHIVGGAGIFDTVSNFFKRLVSSNAAKAVASNLTKAAASDIGKSAINAAKTVGKELATSAISTAKDIAIEKGKQLIAKASSKEAPTPNNAGLPPVISQKSKDILASLVNHQTNISNVINGEGIAIQDLVKRLARSKGVNTGAGLRLA